MVMCCVLNAETCAVTDCAFGCSGAKVAFSFIDLLAPSVTAQVSLSDRDPQVAVAVAVGPGMHPLGFDVATPLSTMNLPSSLNRESPAGLRRHVITIGSFGEWIVERLRQSVDKRTNACKRERESDAGVSNCIDARMWARDQQVMTHTPEQSDGLRNSVERTCCPAYAELQFKHF